MDKYKITDKTICQVETRKSGVRAIFSRIPVSEEDKPKLENKEFEIIAIRPIYPESEHNIYTIVIDDDMIGWRVDGFHIEHQKIDSKFKGKKFWDLTENFMKPVKKE